MRRTPAALLAVLAAVACLGGCGGQDRAAGPRPAPSTASAGTVPSTGPGRSRQRADTPANSPRPMARSAPERLRIPAIGVDTPVMRLGLAADRTVQVPPVAAHAPAGWYDGSPTPGGTGPAVLLGHVTVGAYGDGVFLRLGRLRPGDRVAITLKDGATAGFTVYAVRTVAKDRFPTRDVYGDTAGPELRLITCGGAHVAGGYADNVLVFARLTSEAAR